MAGNYFATTVSIAVKEYEVLLKLPFFFLMSCSTKISVWGCNLFGSTLTEKMQCTGNKDWAEKQGTGLKAV